VAELQQGLRQGQASNSWLVHHQSGKIPCQDYSYKLTIYVCKKIITYLSMEKIFNFP
jgi:hypothetical protein